MIDSNPSAVSFTTGVVIEHEPLKEEKDAKEFKETDVMGLKGKDAEALKEKPEVCCDPLSSDTTPF